MSVQELLQEQRVMQRGEYWEGANLTPEHRRMIHDSHDLWKLAFIDNLPYEVQKKIGSAFAVSNEENRKHYATTFAVWLHGEKYFLGEYLQHSPTPAEQADDVLQRTHLGERFRLFYVLECSERMKLCADISPEQQMLEEAFLMRAEEISDYRYPSRFFSSKMKAVA